MKKRIYIYGCNGGMGRRYRAILKRLGHEWSGFDLDGHHGDFEFADSDGVIIATPTPTHGQIILSLAGSGKPLLCEKPVTRDLDELRSLMMAVARNSTPMQMVCQYDHLVNPAWYGPTIYDYYRTGPDGLPWDCMQIIWHAKQTPEIRNESPVWRCIINGQELKLGDMDRAYVAEIKGWLEAPRNDIARILAAHEKVAKLEAEWRARK